LNQNQVYSKNPEAIRQILSLKDWIKRSETVAERASAGSYPARATVDFGRTDT